MEESQKKSKKTEDLQKRAEEMGIPILQHIPKKIDQGVVTLIAEEVSRKYGIVVFERDDSKQRISIAMQDPHDIDALNILRFLAQKEKYEIDIFLASEETLERLASFYRSAEQAVESAISALDEDEEVVKKKKKDGLGINDENLQDAPVAKLVQVILRHAIDGGASDIHIEPIDKTYRVRFRVDGVLHASLTFPLEVGRAVVSRIKILSSLKIDEKRKPQDGRFRIMEKGNAVDFRVSSLPVVEGEKVVMRVLEKDKQNFDLKALGLMGSQKEVFLEHIRDPFGMILMTGPTGSGKSTTLYAFLKILNDEFGNIVTLEDPVEYFIPGINQSQIKPEIGYNFASGLRSILRQDPDIIMVGEIRDAETAELAIHAALTGHLVFSTVHTNSSIGALPRLRDMGVEPFLIGSSVRVIAAQRLLRRICEDCKEVHEMPSEIVTRVNEFLKDIDPEEVKKYGIDLSNGPVFYKGRGCEQCGNLGLKGRIAIYEVVAIDSELEELIVNTKGDVIALEKRIKEKGYLNLKQDGLLKVLLGLTTMSELERMTEGMALIGGNIEELDERDFEEAAADAGESS